MNKQGASGTKGVKYCIRAFQYWTAFGRGDVFGDLLMQSTGLVDWRRGRMGLFMWFNSVGVAHRNRKCFSLTGVYSNILYIS